MAIIAVTEIRREIIYCANDREVSAVCKFLGDYPHGPRASLGELTFLAPAVNVRSNHE